MLIAHSFDVPQSPTSDTRRQTAILPNNACAKADCTAQQTEGQHPANRSVSANTT